MKNEKLFRCKKFKQKTIESDNWEYTVPISYCVFSFGKYNIALLFIVYLISKKQKLSFLVNKIIKKKLYFNVSRTILFNYLGLH